MVMFAIQFLIVNDVIGMLLGSAVANITHIYIMYV